MMRFLPLAALTALLAACGPAPAPPAAPAAHVPSTAEQLRRLIDQYEDDRHRLDPQALPQGPAIRFDGAGGLDISAQFLADSLALERRTLAALDGMARERLPADEQLTYDLFRRERLLAAESFTYPSELTPVNPYRSVPLEFARLQGGASAANAQQYEAWRARNDAYVRWTQQAIANLREGARRGYAEPKPVIAALLPMLAALSTDSPGNLLAPSPPAAAPGGAQAAGEPQATERARLAQVQRAAVQREVLPAYRRLYEFLRDEYLPRARDSVGVAALPLGGAWYGYLIRRETGSRVSPQELHALGKAEIERLRGRLQALLAEAGFTGTPQAYFEALAAAPRAAARTAQELEAQYEEMKGATAAALPSLFEAAPQGTLLMRPLEAFRSAQSSALTYQRAAERGAAAILYVNPAGPGPAGSVAPSVAALLRTALPGYHYQIAAQQERIDLPRFRRLGGQPAFVEGWGLYAESLGEALGVYHDTESRLAAITDQMACFAGMVADTGMHALGWSRAQALDYVRAQLPNDAAGATLLVDRAIALPAEALACGVGARAFLTWRERAERSLGARFDPKTFHAALLQEGAVPLDILESNMNRWLSAQH